MSRAPRNAALLMVLVVAATLGIAFDAWCAGTPVSFRSDFLRYDKASDSFIARGHVEVDYLGTKLVCDWAQIHRKKRRIFAKGKVMIWRGGLLSRSEAALVDMDASQPTIPSEFADALNA